MTSVFKKQPATPKQAKSRRARLDGLLDPDLFKALAEPKRAQLLACLIKCGRPCNVTEVAECCSVDFSMVARHLAALARAEVLQAEKIGRTVWYTADAASLAQQFRDLADAIDEWSNTSCCTEDECGCNDK